MIFTVLLLLLSVVSGALYEKGNLLPLNYFTNVSCPSIQIRQVTDKSKPWFKAHFERLIESGFNLNEPFNNPTRGTLLHYAVEEGVANMVEALIECSADVFAKNSYGETPIDYVREASERGSHKDVLELFIRMGYIDGLFSESSSSDKDEIVGVSPANNRRFSASNTTRLDMCDSPLIVDSDAIFTESIAHITAPLNSNIQAFGYDPANLSSSTFNTPVSTSSTSSRRAGSRRIRAIRPPTGTVQSASSNTRNNRNTRNTTITTTSSQSHFQPSSLFSDPSFPEVITLVPEVPQNSPTLVSETVVKPFSGFPNSTSDQTENLEFDSEVFSLLFDDIENSDAIRMDVDEPQSPPLAPAFSFKIPKYLPTLQDPNAKIENFEVI